jgi:hypothetical protein
MDVEQVCELFRTLNDSPFRLHCGDSPVRKVPLAAGSARENKVSETFYDPDFVSSYLGAIWRLQRPFWAKGMSKVDFANALVCAIESI